LPNYCARVEYRGTNFHGFQKQPGIPTIQGALEDALLTLAGEYVHVLGAGRTDAGVHAAGQMVSFSLSGNFEIPMFLRSLNALLPNGIAVSHIKRVREKFDPRRDALWREYRYFILNRETPSPLLEEYAFFYSHNLDKKLLGEACELTLGEHDFSAFRVGSEEKNTVRNIMKCEVGEFDCFQGLIHITVRSNSFLYKMVRVLCRALLNVASGKWDIHDYRKKLEGGAGPCAEPLPPHGLFLWDVAYPEDVFAV